MERLCVKWGMLIPLLALTLTSSSARAQSLPQWGTIFAPSAANQTTDVAVAAPRPLGQRQRRTLHLRVRSITSRTG
jgi:hypothetical protein